jgi:hypothetical protein
MKEFVELLILEAVRKLLAARVNELLAEMDFAIPHLELSEYRGASVVVPVLVLSTCERTDKERIVRLDAYSLTIAIALPDTPDSELHCYAYAAAVDKALAEDPALGGVASRAILAGKKYVPPKTPHCGEGWEVVLALRVTVEGGGNDN